MGQAKIFIVDDSPIQLILLEKMLHREGFVVEAFDNGHDLMEGLSGEKPDLVISDIQMPGMNGFDLVEELRNLPKGERLPCFLISSKADTVIRQRVSAVGADGFIKKPFEYRSLMGVIEDLLSENQVAANN
jgi:DNA-binding response OmpR family regulator